MNAGSALIQQIFTYGSLFEIPFFQRSYVWDEELWQRFLEDMEFITKTKKSHFFGALILKAGRKRNDNDLFIECKTVIDGQQRLTTLLIFLKVFFLKFGTPSTFDIQFKIKKQMVALCPSKNDIENFKEIMDTTTPQNIPNPTHKSKIIEAFNFFIDHLDTTKLDIDTILENAQFVRIDLNENEDEQQIFDTINSLGVRLTTSELLKNYFFSRETSKEYDKKWASVFEKDAETKAYWDTEIESGRTKKAMIDIFFDAYFQFFIQNSKYKVKADDKLIYARLDHLSQSYQHFISNYCDGDKNVVLNELQSYASCFKEIFNLDQCDQSVSSEFGIERMNVIIFGLKNTTIIPYVLYVAKNADDTEKNEIYKILESYIMRRIVVNATTKNYNNLFTSLILNQVLTAKDLQEKLTKGTVNSTTYYPDDNELLQGFNDSKLINLQTKGILYLIESKMHTNLDAVTLLGFNKYSLEHLMPKKWRNNWQFVGTDEEKNKRDSILLTLGNLAIITQALNASIRDSDWKTKKEGKGNKLGLIKCASGLHTLADALKKDNWDSEEISSRASWLWEQACSIWKI